MAKQLSGTEIVVKLRQADVQLAQGKTAPEVCRELGISQQTYYRWRNKYGGMSPDMIKQLRALQKENAPIIAACSGCIPAGPYPCRDTESIGYKTGECNTAEKMN